MLTLGTPIYKNEGTLALTGWVPSILKFSQILFLDVCKAVVIQLFEVGKPKSGVTAEQEGVAYMSQLAGGCGLLHPTKLVGVQEAVRGSFVADVEVSERIVPGL